MCTCPTESTGGSGCPVLYMFDGHNVFFDEDATYGKSWGMKRIHGPEPDAHMIIVAVECNHSTQQCPPFRVFSLFTFQEENLGRMRRGRGQMDHGMAGSGTQAHDRRASYPTLPQREATFIAGSSMGGLMSLYAVLVAYNHVFSRAAALSPSIWLASSQGSGPDGPPRRSIRPGHRAVHGLRLEGDCANRRRHMWRSLCQPAGRPPDRQGACCVDQPHRAQRRPQRSQLGARRSPSFMQHAALRAGLNGGCTPMQTTVLPGSTVPALGRDMEMQAHTATPGRPVLFIPCQDGRFFDFENFHMTDAWAPFDRRGAGHGLFH